MIYANSLDLFSSTMNLGRQYAPLPEEGWLTTEFWGLFPLLEWVGCVASLVFLVSGWVGVAFLRSTVMLLHSTQALYMMMWPMFSHVECHQEKCHNQDEEEGEKEQITEQPVEGEELQSPTE